MGWIKTRSRKSRIAAAAICGVLLIGFVVWFVVRYYGITAGERNAAKAALQEIDAMQGSLSASDHDYRERKRAAEDAISVAEGAAVSGRDHSMSADLRLYFLGVDNERFTNVMEPRMIDNGVLHQRSDAKMNALMKEKCSRIRTELHWQLN